MSTEEKNEEGKKAAVKSKRCYVCSGFGSGDEMIQPSNFHEIHRHFKCNGLSACIVCGEPLHKSDYEVKGGGKPNALLISGSLQQMARHTECDVSSEAYHNNKELASNSKIHKEFFNNPKREEQDTMATTAKKKAVKGKGSDIKKKISASKNMTPEQRAVKDLMGRVAYMMYTDTKPTNTTAWKLTQGKVTVERTDRTGDVTLKFGKINIKSKKKDDIITELQGILDGLKK